MNEQQNFQPAVIEVKRSYWLPLLGAGVLAAGMFTVYEGSQTSELRQQVAAYKHENDAIRGKLMANDSQLQSTLAELRDEVANTKQEAATSVGRAKTEASRHADILVKRVEKAQQLQAQQAQMLGEQIGQVKESTTQAQARIDGISNEVGSVKDEVASTKTGLADTNGDLQRVRGDMGVMSGLVATNSKEIQYLRELGDRNIYEFTVTKSQGLQKVGNIQLQLRKSDAKRNRYTVDVLADDKHVEKKDKGANEPVQFYTSSARQPYELVVNEVSKDKIKGYLATPKVTISRASAQ